MLENMIKNCSAFLYALACKHIQADSLKYLQMNFFFW